MYLLLNSCTLIIESSIPSCIPSCSHPQYKLDCFVPLSRIISFCRRAIASDTNRKATCILADFVTRLSKVSFVSGGPLTRFRSFSNSEATPLSRRKYSFYVSTSIPTNEIISCLVDTCPNRTIYCYLRIYLLDETISLDFRVKC